MMSLLAASIQSGTGMLDLTAALVLIGLIIYFILYLRKLRAKETELRDRISKAYADDTIEK